eukprot:1161830-Pelagomonas_calceolata.AAC.6
MEICVDTLDLRCVHSQIDSAGDRRIACFILIHRQSAFCGLALMLVTLQDGVLGCVVSFTVIPLIHHNGTQMAGGGKGG